MFDNTGNAMKDSGKSERRKTSSNEDIQFLQGRRRMSLKLLSSPLGYRRDKENLTGDCPVC
jgi:hypothetical protein